MLFICKDIRRKLLAQPGSLFRSICIRTVGKLSTFFETHPRVARNVHTVRTLSNFPPMKMFPMAKRLELEVRFVKPPSDRTMALTGLRCWWRQEPAFFASVLECVDPTTLRRLNFNNCDITDPTVVLIARHFTELEYLDLSWCHKITAVAIHTIAIKCTKLQHLDVHCCGSIYKHDQECFSANLDYFDCELTDVIVKKFKR